VASLFLELSMDVVLAAMASGGSFLLRMSVPQRGASGAGVAPWTMTRTWNRVRIVN
jgi:hypothetical protein